MKRIFIIILVMAFVFWGLIGCENNEDLFSGTIVRPESNTIYPKQDFSNAQVPVSISVADSMNDGNRLSLDNYPQGNKTGDVYQFYCEVENDCFDKILLCKGYLKDYGGIWVELDQSSVILYGTSKSTPMCEPISHRLFIDGYLYVSMQTSEDGVCVFSIETKGGYFSADLTNWGKNSRGLVEVISVGSTLKNCSLSAYNNDFSRKIWYFGSSWEGFSDNRVFGQLKNLGYYNFYANAWPGRSGKQTFEELKLALQFATPDIIVAVIANMPIKTEKDIKNYKTLFNDFVDLCNEKKIELIVRTHPNTDSNYYDEIINPFIRTSKVRIVDYHKAMKDPNKIWINGFNDCYDGFLSSDHPTKKGAKAIALQVIKDIPELGR